jgi:hypothetical protein
MPRPQGVITVSTTFQHAYLCDVESCECVAAAVASGELADRREVVEDAPNSKRVAGSFELTEEVNVIHINLNGSEDKTVRVGTSLSTK